MDSSRLRHNPDTTSWKCAVIAALNVLVLFLLFQPWLSAQGPLGSVSANAFGQLDGSVASLHEFGELPDEARLAGIWGILVALATLAVLASVWLYWYSGHGFSLVIGASTANAVLVTITLLYLNANTAKVREITAEQHEALQQALRTLSSDSGNQNIGAFDFTTTSATLTRPALICGVAVVLTCLFVLTLRQWTSHQTRATSGQLHLLRTATEPSTWADTQEPALATHSTGPHLLPRTEARPHPHKPHSDRRPQPRPAGRTEHTKPALGKVRVN